MASRRATTGATDAGSPRTEPCHCDTTRNESDPPGAKHCLFPCENQIRKDWTRCRPCAKSNHTGKACRQFQPESAPHLVKTCRRCGYEGPGHARGSDGQPYGDVI